jgi:hypothetical protein
MKTKIKLCSCTNSFRGIVQCLLDLMWREWPGFRDQLLIRREIKVKSSARTLIRLTTSFKRINKSRQIVYIDHFKCI